MVNFILAALTPATISITKEEWKIISSLCHRESWGFVVPSLGLGLLFKYFLSNKAPESLEDPHTSPTPTGAGFLARKRDQGKREGLDVFIVVAESSPALFRLSSDTQWH